MADRNNEEIPKNPALLASHLPSTAAVWISKTRVKLGSVNIPILLEDEGRNTPRTSISSSKARKSSTSSSYQQTDIDLMHDENDYIEIFGDRKAHSKRNPTPTKYEYRNPPIIEPFTSCENCGCNGWQLRPGKTVELKDGDFLRISHIIRDSSTGETKLRGHRLQRTRDLNGMLEKKLNEVCLCLEVDLDDPRDPLEQGAIEVPLGQVVKLRSLRFTNQSFPHCRNVTVSDFRDQNEAAMEGGLTARWKSTCTYATAADRHQNIYQERTLEHMRAEDTTGLYAVSDEIRRFEWRGETVPGGAYRLAIGEDETINLTEEELPSPVNVDVDGSESEMEIIHLCSPKPQLKPKVLKEARPSSSTTPTMTKKRKHSPYDADDSNGRKRVRLDAGDRTEDTRRKLSVIILDQHDSKPTKPSTRTGIWQRSHPTPSTTPSLNVLSSPLSTPPLTGTLLSPIPSTKQRIFRSPSQKLTYGDAFCGAGGTTRGALLAGLHIKWGFDFNPTACQTWRSNFPTSHCFPLASHDFVSLAHKISPSITKVDILHLSPPCQFFSPAHTIQGPDDEMNTASLFAVRSVVEVARPRVVTLEQTFGIVGVRFRGFFNALVQMFTGLGFSVRWAVVGLAQWGLPQRRNRLIIIASCPGEPLPAMPAATHGPGLLPFASVNDTIACIPANAPDHDLDAVAFAPHRFETPWNGNRILPRTMTTHGGNYHPSGKRGFTVREYAALQGFPLEHVFEGSGRKKQIGNAVPPCVAKVLFESIKKDLDRVDRVVGEEPIVIED